FVDAKTDYFDSYVRSYTDLPFLVDLEDDGHGRYRPGRFVTASDLGSTVTAEADTADAEFKPAVWDKRTGRVTIPNGTLGHRRAGAPCRRSARLTPRHTRCGPDRRDPSAALRHRRPGRDRRGHPRGPRRPHRRSGGDHGLRPHARRIRCRPSGPARDLGGELR